MKKILALILAILMLALPLVSCDTSEQKDTDNNTDSPLSDSPETDVPETDAPALREGDAKLYVGYGRECITPYNEDGTLMSLTLAGYAEARPAKSVKDDLYVSCTAIKDEAGAIALLYTLDLHSMQPGTAKNMQKTIAREINISEENIVLNVTHTHAAPHIEQFDEFVTERLLAAAKTAVADLTLVTALYAGTVETENMNYIRRYETDANGKEIAHLWENDPTMPVIRFVREKGKDVILCNWAAHCDSVSSSNNKTISADYVSYFRHKIEAEQNAYVSLHMGASGDVNPSGKLATEPAFPGTARYGEKLANCLLGALDSLERLDIKSEIKVTTNKVKVSFDHSEDETKGAAASEIVNYYWDVAGGKLTKEVNAMMAEKGFKNYYEVEAVRARYVATEFDRIQIGAISIGNIVFATAPYEMFTVNGKNVKDSADEFDLAFMCAYSNGQLGYIASEEAFDYDIYEVYSRRYTKDTATVLQDALIAAIDELGK